MGPSQASAVQTISDTNDDAKPYQTGSHRSVGCLSASSGSLLGQAQSYQLLPLVCGHSSCSWCPCLQCALLALSPHHLSCVLPLPAAEHTSFRQGNTAFTYPAQGQAVHFISLSMQQQGQALYVALTHASSTNRMYVSLACVEQCNTCIFFEMNQAWQQPECS